LAKQRLDTLLVDLDLFLPATGSTTNPGGSGVNQQVIDKPGTEVETSAQIQIKGDRATFPEVVKTPKPWNCLPFRAGRICLDGGISTGGPTACCKLGQKGLRH